MPPRRRMPAPPPPPPPPEYVAIIGSDDKSVQAAGRYFSRRSTWVNPCQPEQWLAIVARAPQGLDGTTVERIASDCHVAITWHQTEKEATAVVRKALKM